MADLKIGTTFILELPNNLNSYEGYPYRSLTAWEKSLNDNFIQDDVKDFIAYEVKITKKYKANSNGITIKEVK